MKNRILCRLLSFGMAALMSAGIAACCPFEKIYGAEMNPGILRINQNAAWTEEENFRGELTVEISGLKAWLDAYKNSGTEIPEEISGAITATPTPTLAEGFSSEGEAAEVPGKEPIEIPTETPRESMTAGEKDEEYFVPDQETLPSGVSFVKFSDGIEMEMGKDNAFIPAEDDIKLMLVTRISKYFQVDEETFPESNAVREALYPGQDGGLEVLTEVVCPVSTENVTENACVVEIPLILREEYRYCETARILPVHYDKPDIHQEAGSETEKGTFLAAVRNGTMETIIKDDSDISLETVAAPADYTISVEMETETPRPGQTLKYLVNITNTGRQPLPLISLESSLEPDSVSGVWDSNDNQETDISGKRAIITDLKVGETRQMACEVKLPEELTETEVTNTITASAQKMTESEEPVVRSDSLKTAVTPLIIDFTVNKTADRTTAGPGDTITYQICIRNTGERTLHSVLSTERFQEENIKAYFLEKEGVLLNSDKTQALISRIPPGEVFSLEAEVALPEKLKSSELINQVLVRTRETGDTITEASSGVKILEISASPLPEQPGTKNQGSTSADYEGSGGVSDAPKTSDDSNPLLWAVLLVLTFLSALAVFGYLHFEKRKY